MQARVSGWVVVAVLFSILYVYGQVTTGTISGMVSDSSGGAIPAAEVVILNEDTNVSRVLKADAAGRYSAPSLNPGRYRVTASLQGFQTEVRSGIQLTVGRDAIVNFDLQVGQVTEQIEVTGEAPLVQTRESAVSYLVDDRTIRELPLNGRDIGQLILLNPGVVQSKSGRGGSSETGFAKRISISGMRGEENAYLLDGTYVNDYMRHVPAGPTGALTGVETVQEFQMLTSTFSAQYGRALGGVFNAISKSGTNELHGSAYDFLRNSALDARNYFDRQSTPSGPRLPPFRRNQFGATFGGPIVRDNIFFFVAYEGLRQSLTNTGISVVPDLNARRGILPTQTVQISSLVAPFLRLYPEPTPGGRNFGNGTAQYIFQANQPTREDFGQARTDYRISDSDSLFVRFTGNHADQATYNGFPNYFTIGLIATRLATLSETHVFSPRLLNTVRFAFNRVVPGTDADAPTAEPGTISVPGQPLSASIDAGSGTTVIGGAISDVGARYTTNRFGLHDDMNLNLGNHTLQFGGMVDRLQFNANINDYPFGDWQFSSVANFLQGVPSQYRGTPSQLANHRRGLRQWFLALYLQDDWRVKSNLTLNLGLRWEPYTVATEVNGLIENLRRLTDPAPTVGDPYWLNKAWWNFSPRVGFAWSPFQSGKTSLRGGVGLYYVPIDPAVYYQANLRAPSFAPQFDFDDPCCFPSALGAIAAGGGTALSNLAIDAMPFEDTRSPQAVQYSLSLQQQIGANNVLTFGYNGRRAMRLAALANVQTPLAQFNGLSLELPANATRVNPAYSNEIAYNLTKANAWYNGFTAVLQRRFFAGFQGQISYTFSRALSETDGSESGPTAGIGGSGTVKYPYDLGVNKGLSGYHLQNVFTANYSYDLPLGRGASGWVSYVLSGWQLTGIVSLQDGQPFTISAQTPRALQPYNSRVSPNLKPGWTSDQIVLGDPNNYYTLDAFTPPGAREFGNYGRSTLIGPGLAQWDMGFTKNTQLGEQWRLQFRAEAFNVLNRTNFGSAGGRRGEAFNRSGAAIPSAPVITNTVTTARQLQFGLKLIF
ncbi:MAG: TonB-dependent receptor [Acidobacteria bacterium]|nr:TonB-dependent receptor [Acidobacteriota bacterium]